MDKSKLLFDLKMNEAMIAKHKSKSNHKNTMYILFKRRKKIKSNDSRERKTFGGAYIINGLY